MAINNYKDGDFLRALEEDIEAQNVELREQMAIAIVGALQQTEEHGDMWELVNDMLNIDEGLVSKLEFLISTSFIERNLDKIEGGRYAN